MPRSAARALVPAPSTSHGFCNRRPTIHRTAYGTVDQSAKGSESGLNPDPAIDVVQTRTTPTIASGT